jgi:Predicted Co/Zn/Cd cation transporters
MDGNYDMEPYRVIALSVNETEGASNPHRAKVRRVAGLWDIDFDIDIDPKCTVLDAHNIALEVERRIKENLENVYDIMIHIEPRGDNIAEGFGLSERDMLGEKDKGE